jgi:uncharacterized protein (TIGR03084 family)
MPDLVQLADDLRAEHAELDAFVSSILPGEWDTPTPAVGWSVRDQVSHLSFFDEEATLAATDPEAFNERLMTAAADIDGYMNGPLAKGRAITPEEMLEWWRGSRASMLEAFAGVDPAARIPWYGPPMGLASFISARLMETWAHGQDVIDALGAKREPTERLRHVAFLGVRARRNSYAAHGMEMPEGEVRVELHGSDGDVWTFGDASENVVRGSAEGFCLLVTQRRHPADTDVETQGPLAAEWMSIAQAFAGPPGEGRRPGQFG